MWKKIKKPIEKTGYPVTSRYPAGFSKPGYPGIRYPGSKSVSGTTLIYGNTYLTKICAGIFDNVALPIAPWFAEHTKKSRLRRHLCLSQPNLNYRQKNTIEKLQIGIYSFLEPYTYIIDHIMWVYEYSIFKSKYT